MIACASPRAAYAARRAEIDAAIARVLETGHYVLGDEVAAFERDFAAYVGVRHGVGVGSGTEALHLALAACGIGREDEVITVSHTAVATVAAIEAAGATPVLVDIEPAYFTLDPAKLEAAITARTRAIVAVHLYGQAAALEEILAIARSRGIRVIEDCAQAHGASYRGRRLGAWGDISCFSFYPTKNLGAIGDGGFVATDDPEIAGRVRALREYGWTAHREAAQPGWNSRLDEIQAAILNVKLRHLDADNASRASLAARYDRELADTCVTTPARRAGGSHVFHLYVVRSPEREALRSFLGQREITALVHYPAAVHQQPAYRDRLGTDASLPCSARAAGEVLSLPMHPELEERDLLAVAAAIREFSTGRR